MATSLPSNFHCSNLLDLNNKQLISKSMDLIDKASTDALLDCFENVFKDSIMKYLLKIVIKQEITQLSTTDTNTDWKRVSLISKISKLKETPTKITKKYMDKNKLIKDESSTDQLLVCGYIRNEMNINNNNFPHDILSVCLRFIGDISNINNQQLMFFSHKDRQYSSIFTQQSSTKLIANKINYKQFATKCFTNVNLQKLVGANNILLFDELNDTKSNETYIHQLPHYPKADVLVSNIQYVRQTNTSLVGNHNDELFGVVQCLDIKNLRLLNFGGIRKTRRTVNPMMIGGLPDHYKTENLIYQLNYNDYNDENKWNKAGMLIHARGYMSLCDINHSKIAIIGGQKLPQQNLDTMMPGMGMAQPYNTLPMDCIELFDLENDNNNNVTIKNMNYKRIQCGSYYNKYSNELIVFGGNNHFSPDGKIVRYFGSPMNTTNNENISNSMEIYDFHKNIWNKVPYLSNKSYNKYPCIWTVGNKCIFVAEINGASMCPSVEWIDLRVCRKNKFISIEFDAYDGYKEHDISMFVI